MAKSKKKQSELEGFEAPGIAEIDNAVGYYLEAKSERVEAEEREKSRREALHQIVADHKEALDKNDAGEPCYRYTDGELTFVVTLKNKEKLSVRKATEKATAEAA